MERKQRDGYRIEEILGLLCPSGVVPAAVGNVGRAEHRGNNR